VPVFVDVPHLFRNEEDLDKFLDELSLHDMLEYIRQQRPDTKWAVHLKIWSTICGKVEDAISLKLNYASPGHGFHCFPEFGWYTEEKTCSVTGLSTKDLK
jgi:hypothetical protein